MTRAVQQGAKVNQIILNKVVDDVREAADQATTHTPVKDTPAQWICGNLHTDAFHGLHKAAPQLTAFGCIASCDAAQLRLEVL